MSRFAKLFLMLPIVFVQVGCNKILEPVNLKINNLIKSPKRNLK